jgi:hypothetical protein
MADFFANDRNVAWVDVKEEFTQVIAKWEQWCADEIEFGADPEDGFCEGGATINGVRAVVANIKNIVDRMERS